MARKRRQKSRRHIITIRIPLTSETLTAAMLLLQEILALARTMKIPLQAMKEGQT